MIKKFADIYNRSTEYQCVTVRQTNRQTDGGNNCWVKMGETQKCWAKNRDG